MSKIIYGLHTPSDVEVYEGDKIGAQTGIFVLEWFLKDGSHEDFELML
jgi:hypothetical protein